MRPMLSRIGAAALFVLCANISQAASLRVAPTNLELIAPDSAAVLNLHNDAKQPDQRAGSNLQMEPGERG